MDHCALPGLLRIVIIYLRACLSASKDDKPSPAALDFNVIYHVRQPNRRELNLPGRAET